MRKHWNGNIKFMYWKAFTLRNLKKYEEAVEW